MDELAQKTIDREILQKIKEVSDANFEKSITYISAGALALSMTFVEKVVPFSSGTKFCLLITAWILLTITLLVNLLSHYLSSCYHEKTIEEFDSDCENINTNLDSRNKIIRWVNIGTIFTLFLGILSLIIFLSINLS